MLETLLKNKKFQSEISRFFKENEQTVIDIVLFGSILKGKEKPRDIDIMLIFKKSVDINLAYTLRKSLENLGLNIEVTSITYAGLFSPDFIARESFLLEGYSLITKKPILQGLGFSSFVIFKYDLSKLTKSERMRFYYSLYGRNKQKGMLKELNAKKFSDSIILSPIKTSEQTKSYLNTWKIKYIEIPVFIPDRFISSEVLK